MPPVQYSGSAGNGARSVDVEQVFRALSSVAQSATSYPDNHLLIQAGQSGDGLWLLEKGAVRIESLAGETILLQAPNVLGEVSFLSGGATTANVRAQGPVTVVRLSSAAIATRLIDALQVRAFYEALSRLAITRLAGAFHTHYVALVAHDARKESLVQLVREHHDLFATRHLVATSTTGARIADELGIEVVRRVRSGPHGGDQEIGAMVARGLVDAVFFFRDPLWAQPHGDDVNALVRVCELMNVPLATNRATADALIGLLRASPVSIVMDKGHD
jgi:methylglyoxal synthase